MNQKHNWQTWKSVNAEINTNTLFLIQLVLFYHRVFTEICFLFIICFKLCHFSNISQQKQLKSSAGAEMVSWKRKKVIGCLIFLQVNSDVVFHKRDRYGTLTPYKVDKTHVGQSICTKAVGGYSSVDVTHTYKYPEGNAQLKNDQKDRYEESRERDRPRPRRHRDPLARKRKIRPLHEVHVFSCVTQRNSCCVIPVLMITEKLKN